MSNDKKVIDIEVLREMMQYNRISMWDRMVEILQYAVHLDDELLHEDIYEKTA